MAIEKRDYKSVNLKTKDWDAIKALGDALPLHDPSIPDVIMYCINMVKGENDAPDKSN